MVKAYILLALSIIFELIATNFLKLSNGFENIVAFILAIIFYAISFYVLSVTLRTISLSIAYAIWAGVGTVLTAAIGIIIWDEAFGFVKAIAFALIIMGVILLNLSEDNSESST